MFKPFLLLLFDHVKYYGVDTAGGGVLVRAAAAAPAVAASPRVALPAGEELSAGEVVLPASEAELAVGAASAL